MKIQLKKSNVLENGSAKRPIAEQMEYGELAVNYNTNDPVIFLKDSNNQIISIEINKIGTIDSGTTPPGIDNNTGDLFFDVSNNQLLFWNGSSWVPLNTNLGYTAAPTKGTVTNTSGDDADIPLATGVNAGLLSPEQYTKLLNLVGVVLDSPSNGLTLNNGELSVNVASADAFGTVKVGTGLAIDGNGILSVTVEQDFLTSVDLAYQAEPTYGQITNSGGSDVTIPLADTVRSGLMAPSSVQFLGELSGKNILEEVNLEYLKNGDGDGVVTNSAGTGFSVPVATSTYAGLMTSSEKQKLAGLTPGGGGDGGLTRVDLSYSESSDRGTIQNSGGDNAVIPIANTFRAGLMAPGDVSKLNGLPSSFPSPNDGQLGFFNAEAELIQIFTANQSANSSVALYSTTGKMEAGTDVNAGRDVNATGDVIAGGNINSTGDVTAGGNFNGVKIGTGAGYSQDTSSNGIPIAIGQNTLENANSSSTNNIAIGDLSLQNITSGSINIGIGRNTLNSITDGFNNVALGSGAARNGSYLENCVYIGYQTGLDSSENLGSVAIGSIALTKFVPSASVNPDGESQTRSRANTAIGFEALRYATTGEGCTAVGYGALRVNTTGTDNTAVGERALNSNTDGANNTAVGRHALQYNTSGGLNTAVGKNALRAVTSGQKNTGIGANAGRSITTSEDCTFVGNDAGPTATASGNTAVGRYSLYFSSSSAAIDNVAIGKEALMNNNNKANSALGVRAGKLTVNGSGNNYEFCSFIGIDSATSGNAQVQLGSTGTSTYAYGSVQNRSDARDKTEVRDTLLGLDFVNSLRPVDFKWDYRESYIDVIDETDENDEPTTRVVHNTRDGSRCRNRFHHGLIAQEVKAAADAQGIDFAGYQDHSINGGDDVLSIGYTELIAPLIKAVQELSAENADLKARIEALESN